MMIKNWVKNTLTDKDINRFKLYSHLYSYHHQDEQIFIIDGLSILKVILDTINPEARVSTRGMKDRLCSVDIS